MSKRTVVVMVNKEQGNDVVVVTPQKGVFTARELEEYMESDWAEEACRMPEVSDGAVLFSETRNSIIIVHSGKGSVEDFSKKIIEHVRKLFTVATIV